ncbi:LAQU0S18e01728g1_1 [Lachancea quebecensis]|uniref:LAQU0S18e01728g1_1 n=1 Tax=Lachancea quebecensis TaxID=1654605 RepID=A0A0N7MMC0_9SACH|nr:LAQU0S18e01728g1_1 [Lachancea quebecensis]
MQATTPISETRLKKVHTPPSRGSNSPSSLRSTKKKSSGVMNRVNLKFRALSSSSLPSPSRLAPEERPRIVHASSTRLPTDNDSYFWPSTLPSAKPMANARKRRNTPAPLTLSQITPHATPQKPYGNKETTPKLESPMNFRHSTNSSTDNASWVTASTFNPRRRLNFELQGNFDSPLDDAFTINRSSRSPWEDLYPECESPTYAAQLRSNVSKLSGPRNYASSKCSICNEDLMFTLSGEKLIELSCNHQCHFNCYLITFEALLPESSFPQCSVCTTASKPKSEDVMSEITAKILTREGQGKHQTLFEQSVKQERAASEHSGGSNVWPQTIFPGTQDTPNDNNYLQELRTPHEQLIKSAQVSCEGFKEHFSTQSTPRSKFSKFSSSDSFRTPSSASQSEWHRKDFELNRPHVNIIPQLSKFSIKENSRQAIAQYVLSTYTPNNPTMAKGVEDYKNLIRKEAQSHVQSSFDYKAGMGALETFDILSYSEDEEVWVNVNALLFRECLVFVQEDNLVGHILKDQISEMHQLDPHTLILNLKSKSLPEIFLCCPEDPSITRKWTYYLRQVYLTHGGEHVPLTQLTSNNWGFLPPKLTKKICKPSGTDFEDQNLSGAFAPQEKTRLKLILCVSVVNCHPELHANNEHLLSLKAKIKQTVDSLSSQDLLGLVLVGRDGSGNVGAFGTFFGMVGKDWDGWEEILESLEVYDNDRIFANDSWELNVMLETSRKLMCIVEQDESFLQQLVILGNDYSGNMSQTIEDDLQVARLQSNVTSSLQKFRFSVHQYFTCNSRLLLSDITEGCFYNVKCEGLSTFEEFRPDLLVQKLQKKTAKSFVVSLGTLDPNLAQFHAVERNGQLCKLPGLCTEITMEIGALAPGEARNLIFEIEIDVQNLKHLLENALTSNHPALLHYNAAWHDGSRRLVFSGCSIGCEFKLGNVSTALPPPDALRGPSQLGQDMNDETEILEVMLAPPLSASRDALFATRHVELIAIETLRSALAQFPYNTHALLNQLVPMIFCISRSCVCNDANYHTRVSTVKPLPQLVEQLCADIQEIAARSVSGNGADRALSRWEMAQMVAALACGTYCAP